MKLPNCLKNLNSRKGNEKGSVTLFVLIAMLFFLMIGMMIFIINMNTETSQKRDVEKIKSEYSSGTSETDLEQMYQEAKARQLATFLIKLIDSNGNIYNSGEWINKKWLDENRMPLKIVPEFPAGVTNIDVTIIDETVAGRPSVHVKDTDELKRMTIGAANDKQYTIVNNVDTTNQIKVNIDTTLPTVTKPAGGTIWKGTAEETVTGTDAGGTVTITASDNLSGVKELKYIINNSKEAPSADAEWTTVEGATAQVTINNEKDLGVYYIHIIATDVAGNASEVVTSGPYEVKQANYKITTTTGTTYSETLKDAAEKPGAMVIKVLNTFTDDVAATIAQNVTIDTNGKTLTMAETITVAAHTTATFVDTATTKGKLQRVVADGVRGDLITNNGTVVVGVQNSETGPTLTSKDVVIKNGTVTVYSGIIASQGQSATVDNAGIYSGTINVYGGNITNDNGNYGIVVGNNGRCNISGGTVSGKMAICPQNGTLTVSESANIQGRLVGVTTSSDAHKYTLNMTGGTISSIRGRAIQSQTKVNITITGGTITGATEGINITGANSTVTIGDNTNALDRTTPVITGTNGKGINIAGATSTLNYYDGTINGKTKALASDGKRTYFGREVTFDVPNDATVNFLTETEENNVTRYYRPYTREKKDNNNVIYYETVLEKQVNVTFNPGEGATVAESNRNVLTNVEYKEKAEDATIVSLPTPEKTGYTFKGWNGKNLLNPDNLIEGRNIIKNNDGSISASDKTSDGRQWNYDNSNLKMSLPAGTYTLSLDFVNQTTSIYSKLRIYKDDSNYIKFNIPLNDVSNQTTTFTLNEETNIGIELKLYDAEVYMQLEKNNTATAYQPYYIIDDTKVVQDKDHTLNAIWEANEYTVHFNGDGSTAGTVEDQKFKYDEEKALNENKFERKYTVTYDGNEGTPAKADDTATYTFANWGNKDILGYDLDFSEASKNTGTKYGKENGYKTISLDATEASSDKDMAKWTIQPQFNSGDRYKLTFYAKGNNLTTYFYGASNYLRVSKSESSQGVEHTANNNSTYSDGRIDFALTDEWTKYSVIYTLGSYGDRNVNKYVLFRVMHGNIASIYGVRFEKLENEEHQDKAVVKNLTSEPNGEVTLYAVWTPHEVTLPTATREGYIFNGWYDAATGGNKIGDAGDKYIPEADTTLHAQWRQVHYTILVGEENLVAETLEEAIKLAEDRITGSVTTATITATMNYNDNSTANIKKNITIDTKGHNITMAETITVASGATATFVDTAETKGKLERTTGDLITNSGTVVANSGTLQSNEYAIKNNATGTININGENALIIGTTGEAIDGTTGIVNINNGTIQGATYGLKMDANGTLNFNGGTIIGTTKALASEGKRTYYGREVTFDAPNDATVNFLTETEANNVTRYYRPYTRQNEETHLFETVLEKQVNVTFNPGEGATVAESNRNVLTNVEYKEKAEDATIVSLPTPEKTGYTFKGWNGKNLLNIDEATVRNNYNGTYGVNARVENDRIILSGTNNKTDKNYSLIRWKTDLPQLEVGKKYNLSVSENLENVYVQLNYINTSGEDKLLVNTLNSGVVTIPNDYTKTNYLFIGIDKNATTVNYNFTVQLEEGSTATAYEPYFITDNTKVVQDQDHTLKAIWEATPYTVTADANGGIITAANGWTAGIGNLTANKDITYDTAYGTLPTVARTGYTFDKWTGKNLFDKDATAYKVNYYIKEDGTEENLSEYSEYKVSIKPNTTYTITNSGGSRAPGYVIFDASGTRLAGEGYAYRKTVTFTTPNTASYIIFSVVKVRASTRYDKDTFQLEEGSTATSYEPYKTITAESILATDCDHKIYAHWTPRTDTAYTVNHYTHDIGAETYTLNSTDNLQGTSDASVTLADLKKTIAGYTYEEGFITGNTTKPDSGAVATTTIAADGSRVINLYYRPNYLYVQYHMNTGSLSNNHGTGYGTSGDLVTDTSNTTPTNHLRGVYGSKIGSVTISTYAIATNGLHNYNNSGALNIVKTGYRAKLGKEWNTAANGNGISYNQDIVTYKAIDMATACGKDLSTGDQVITLYVNWEPIPYTISYELNKGTNNSSNPTGYTIETENITLQNPTRNGYTFIGWTGSNGDTPQTTVTIPKGSTGDRTYTANWEANNYTVTAHANGGAIASTTGWEGTGESATKQVTYDSAYGTLPSAEDVSKTGYTFKGWKINGEGDFITNETIVTTASNHTLKAVWEAKKYTLTISADGGTIPATTGWNLINDGASATKEVTFDSAYGVIPKPSRTGCTFDGWYTGENGTGDKVTETTEYTTDGTTTLHAKWTANTYTIHFDANGGTGEMTDLPMTYGTPANLTANAFSRTGYKFVKWTTNADGTGNEYIDGQSVNNLTVINNATINLFAQWEERPFVVTFNPNGGIVTPESKEIIYNSAYGDLPSGDNIKRLGYTFAGWYKEAELTNEVTSETIYDITDDSTLYAKWTPHEYTVTFDKNGGTGTMSDQSFTYGQAQNLRANTFTRTGYTFAGWARAENGTVEFTNGQSVSNLTPENSGTITLYAVWTDITMPSWRVILLNIINK